MEQKRAHKLGITETQTSCDKVTHTLNAPLRNKTPVDLLGQFSNLAPDLKALVKARSRLLKGELRRSEEPVITDFRGPSRRNWQKCQTPLAPEKVADLVAEYDAGTPVKVLVERYGIPRQTVCRHVQRAGVVRRPKPFNDDDVASMVAMYEAGLGLERIGARVSASPMRVRRALVGAGVEIRPQQGGHQSRHRCEESMV